MTEETDNQQEIQFFKKAVSDYLKINEEIKVLDGAIKQRREKKSCLSETIMTFLQEKDISHINLQGNLSGKQMLCEVKERKTSINPKTLEDVIKSYFDNQEEADKLLDMINDTRKTSTVSKLKIANPKKAKGRKKAAELESLIKEGEGEAVIPEHMKYLYNDM